MLSTCVRPACTVYIPYSIVFCNYHRAVFVLFLRCIQNMPPGMPVIFPNQSMPMQQPMQQQQQQQGLFPFNPQASTPPSAFNTAPAPPHQIPSHLTQPPQGTHSTHSAPVTAATAAADAATTRTTHRKPSQGEHMQNSNDDENDDEGDQATLPRGAVQQRISSKSSSMAKMSSRKSDVINVRPASPRPSSYATAGVRVATATAIAGRRDGGGRGSSGGSSAYKSVASESSIAYSEDFAAYSDGGKSGRRVSMACKAVHELTHVDTYYGTP